MSFKQTNIKEKQIANRMVLSILELNMINENRYTEREKPLNQISWRIKESFKNTVSFFTNKKILNERHFFC